MKDYTTALGTLRLIAAPAVPKTSPSGPSPPGDRPPTRPRPGRLALYIHSDRDTPIKGVAVARITTDTDFAARTEEVGRFARDLAKYAYAAQSTDWADIVHQYGHLRDAHAGLVAVLRETVVIDHIVIVNA